MKKKKKKIKKSKYPQKLNREDYFKCPIWFGDAPEFVSEIDNASDKYIDEAKKNMQPSIDKRNKANKIKGDLGSVYHSTTLIGDPKFKGLTNYIGATSHNLLLEMGFDMSQVINYLLQKCGYKNLLKVGVDTIHYIHIGMVTYLVFIF